MTKFVLIKEFNYYFFSKKELDNVGFASLKCKKKLSRNEKTQITKQSLMKFKIIY